jgi:predicted O-methyltransferase YrrM
MVWYRIKSFFSFYWKAITKYNVQSPFLYDFLTNILDTDKNYYAFSHIESERNRLKSVTTSIALKDYGAGSITFKGKNRKIGDIASTSLSGNTKCRILFQLANHYQCKYILELGTSLGISSAYLASADHQAQVVTLEGDENIAIKAKEVHHLLGLKNIMVTTGVFTDSLPKVLTQLPRIDLVFIDGHHEEHATLEYFHQILKKCNEQSIIVVDDIYWSEGMTRAWQSIITHPNVRLSIDLYDIGIVFFRKELSKQALSYIPFKYKPWKIGLFG